MTTECVAIGVDVGTGGVRAMAVELNGNVRATAETKFPARTMSGTGPCVEQDPQSWSDATESTLQQLTAQLHHVDVVGVAVDATSGTFLLVDKNNMPLTPGIMYNDQRAVDVTPEVASELEVALARYGIQIAASFALPKIVHLLRGSERLRQQCRQVVHQTDWIVSLLTGRIDVTDISTALKTGADPGTLLWPEGIQQLGIAPELLPRIVLPGTPIGQVSDLGARRTGLRAGTPVIAGCTDGTAGCLASGAHASGQLNVTLGTTLVFKAISPAPIVDPAGALYNHRHPAGGYLPGAASSTGGDWIESHFAGADLDQLGQEARPHVPTGEVVYPLVKQGERFPFACSTAQGFGLEQIIDPARRFAAGMEAVAFLERMAIDQFEQLGLPIGPTVFATGGGTTSDLWLEMQAELGVEVSGHHFFGVLGGGDDGLFTALVLLALLQQTGSRLADWLAEVGWPAITPDLRIPYGGDSASVLQRIAATCGGDVSRMDGVRTEYVDNGWALARASITEPAITFRFEGGNAEHVREIARRFLISEPELCQSVMEKIL